MEQYVETKIYYHSNGNEEKPIDIRRLHLPTDITFDDLIRVFKSQQSWADGDDPLVEFKYLDNEGEWVRFQTQVEWELCITDTTIPVVKIQVVKNSIPTSDKVISFVKGINLNNIWTSVVSNVTSLEPIVNSFAQGLCHSQIIDDEEEEAVQPVQEVDEKGLRDLEILTEKTHERIEDIPNNVVYTPVEMECNRSFIADEGSWMDCSEDNFSNADFDACSYDVIEEVDPLPEAIIEVPEQYKIQFHQIMDMGFTLSDRPKVIEYLIEFDGDVNKVIQQILED